MDFFITPLHIEVENVVANLLDSALILALQKKSEKTSVSCWIKFSTSRIPTRPVIRPNFFLVAAMVFDKRRLSVAEILVCLVAHPLLLPLLRAAEYKISKCVQ